MTYTAIAREVWTRLEFHANVRGDAPAGEDSLLLGLKVKKAGDFRIDGNDDLPLVTMVDISGGERVGHKTPTRVTLFLKTKKSAGWFSESGGIGLADWMERIADAVETSPSTGKADPYLALHNADGTEVKDALGAHKVLLSDPISWDFRMAEISDMAFTMQMEIEFVLPAKARANRRTSPVAASDYSS